MIVLDVNAAIAIAEGTEDGMALRSLMFSGEKVIAPGIFLYEMVNAMWKSVRSGLKSEDRAMVAIDQACQMIDEFHSGKDMVQEVLAESARCNHPAYDLFYLVLARRNAATLFTLDKRLNALCDELHVNRIHDVRV